MIPTNDNSQQLQANAPLRPFQLVWLALAVFVVSAGYGALAPLLPTWLKQFMVDSDANELAKHVGYLSAAYSAGVLIGAPLWGIVSDRLGPIRVLLAGLVGYVLSVIALLRPDFLGVFGLYAMRWTTGFFVAAVIPVVSAIVARYTPPATRSRHFAWLGAMSLLGFLFGPAFNLFLERANPWILARGIQPWPVVNTVILASALLGAIIMVGLAAALPSDAAAEKTNKPIRSVSAEPSGPGILWLINATVMFVLAGFELGLVLEAGKNWSLQDISVMFAECSLVMLLIDGALFFTNLLDRISPRKVLLVALVVAVAGLGLLAFDTSGEWRYIGVSLTSAGTGVALPTISFLAAGLSPSRLGATMGGLAATSGLGQTFGSALAGWLFSVSAISSFAWLAAPLVAILGWLAVKPDKLVISGLTEPVRVIDKLHDESQP